MGVWYGGIATVTGMYAVTLSTHRKPKRRRLGEKASPPSLESPSLLYPPSSLPAVPLPSISLVPSTARSILDGGSSGAHASSPLAGKVSEGALTVVPTNAAKPQQVSPTRDAEDDVGVKRIILKKKTPEERVGVSDSGRCLEKP